MTKSITYLCGLKTHKNKNHFPIFSESDFFICFPFRQLFKSFIKYIIKTTRFTVKKDEIGKNWKIFRKTS